LALIERLIFLAFNKALETSGALFFALIGRQTALICKA